MDSLPAGTSTNWALEAVILPLSHNEAVPAVLFIFFTTNVGLSSLSNKLYPDSILELRSLICTEPVNNKPILVELGSSPPPVKFWYPIENTSSGAALLSFPTAKINFPPIPCWFAVVTIDLISAISPPTNLPPAKEELSATNNILPNSSPVCSSVVSLDPSNTNSVPVELSFLVFISKVLLISSLLLNPIPIRGSLLLPVWDILKIEDPVVCKLLLDNTNSNSPLVPEPLTVSKTLALIRPIEPEVELSSNPPVRKFPPFVKLI